MISAQQICRAQEARARGHKSYSFARAGDLWIPRRKLHVGGIHCAFSPSFPSLSAGADTPLEWPGAGNLVSWHNWYFDRSYNTLLNETGTVPPDITTTGTIPVGLGLEVRIPTGQGGARGTAQFQWSPDNGVTWSSSIVTAATYALSGAGSGVTLNFDNATYTDDNYYRLKQNEWRDLTPNNYDFIEDAPSNNPAPQVTPLGTAVQFSLYGAEPELDRGGILRNSTGLADELAGGADNDWTFFSVCKLNDTALTGIVGMILFLGSTSSTAGQWVAFNTTPNWICGKYDDTHAGNTVAGGTPNTSVHVLEMVHSTSGTPNTTILVDGTIVAGPTTQNYGVLTLDVASIGSSFISGAIGGTSEISYYEMLTYNAGLDAVTRADIRQRLKNPYGIA